MNGMNIQGFFYPFQSGTQSLPDGHFSHVILTKGKIDIHLKSQIIDTNVTKTS